jgi:hypothetical protein
MSKCEFSIAFNTRAEQMVEKARHEIHLSGGTFEGDVERGSFSINTPLGPVKGVYTIEAQVFVIEIKDKPMLVSCGRIENELRRYMETTTLTSGTSDTGDEINI